MVGKSISSLLRKLGPVGYKQLSKLIGSKKATQELIDVSGKNLKTEMLTQTSFDKWFRQTVDGLTDMKMKEIEHARTLARDYGGDWHEKVIKEINNRYAPSFNKFIKNPDKKRLFNEYMSVGDNVITEGTKRTISLSDPQFVKKFNNKNWLGVHMPYENANYLNRDRLSSGNWFGTPIHEIKHFAQTNLNKRMVPIDWSTMRLSFSDIFGHGGYQAFPVNWGGLKEVPAIMRRQNMLSKLDPRKIIEKAKQGKRGYSSFGIDNMDDWYEAVGKGSGKGRMFYRLRPSELSARMTEYRALPPGLKQLFEKGQTLGLRELKQLKSDINFATKGMSGSFKSRLKKLNKFHGIAPVGALTQTEDK
tara:strand:- start:1006 stop:2088 length:1083 start_codon:yes stop_codon:yes gene_type:complete